MTMSVANRRGVRPGPLPVLLSALLWLVVGGGILAPATRATAEQTLVLPPKVVVVVGPVGSLTDRYRRDGRAAAAEARRWTPDVTLIESPNATWPAVKAAVQGASLLVYLGHGNGFPSPYGARLNPATMDGLGLNPSGGAPGDSRHVYYGEATIARSVRLAPGAIVLLSHLCYASGNSEPGMADGTLAVALRRADNFAAGFLAAGASAVIAEAYGSPVPWVRTLLGGAADRSLRGAWRGYPAAHGRELVGPSERTTGAVVRLDPERPAGGYMRSLVERPGVTVGNLRARIPAAGSAVPEAPIWLVVPPVAPLPQSLPARGVEFGTPSLSGTPVAGGTRELTIPISVPTGITLPIGLAVALRWRRLDTPVVVVPVAGPGGIPVVPPATSPAPAPAGSAPPALPTASPTPVPSGAPTAMPSAAPSASSGPSAALDPGPDPAGAGVAVPSSDPRDPPEADPGVVEPAGPALVVADDAARGPWALVPATVRAGALVARLELPATPGLWSLEISLADGSGRELAEVDARIDDLRIRVGRPFDGVLVAPATVRMQAGSTMSLLVRATNTGEGPWTGGQLTGRWVALVDGAGVPTAARAGLATEPGQTAEVGLILRAPSTPGPYLLLLDVETASGSLAAGGMTPSLVRVTVTEPAGAATPAP